MREVWPSRPVLLADERESECEAGQGVQCHTLKLQRS